MNYKEGDITQGKLYIVSTPIGNLEDITLRALNTLKEVDLIAAEDTRTTRKLLSHFKISKPMTSYHSYNKSRKGTELIRNIERGTTIALLSEAGTPGISDPSFLLIKLAIEKNISIIPIPGPCAAVTALSSSGLKIDRFAFEGFLPRKKGKRRKRIEQYKENNITFVIYESPKRIKNTLVEIHSILGNRKIALARELTKIYEEVIRGSILDIIKEIDNRKKLGEITVVCEGD